MKFNFALLERLLAFWWVAVIVVAALAVAGWEAARWLLF